MRASDDLQMRSEYKSFLIKSCKAYLIVTGRFQALLIVVKETRNSETGGAFVMVSLKNA